MRVALDGSIWLYTKYQTTSSVPAPMTELMEWFVHFKEYSLTSFDFLARLLQIPLIRLRAKNTIASLKCVKWTLSWPGVKSDHKMYCFLF